MTYTTYAEHAIAWEASRERAIVGQVCFCVHGCSGTATHIPFFFGSVVPGLCDDCFAETKTKAGRKAHGIMRHAYETWTDPDEASEPEPTGRHIKRFIQRFSKGARRDEAEKYVREYGNQGLRTIATLHDRMEAGFQLTDGQVDIVLRSKSAEVKSSKAAARRLAIDERRSAKVVDLNRIFVGDEVADGSYALETAHGVVIVKVERPKDGTLHGFVTLNSIVGEGVEKWGVVYPQPAERPDRVARPEWRQFYRGHNAHLVAELVSNPEAARERYERLEDAL